MPKESFNDLVINAMAKSGRVFLYKISKPIKERARGDMVPKVWRKD